MEVREHITQIDLLKEVRIFKESSGIKRSLAFSKIFTQFSPLVYSLLKKLTPQSLEEKDKAIQFIRIQLFDIINERSPKRKNGKALRDENGQIIMRYKDRLKFGLPQQMTEYISGSLDKRVNKDHFRSYTGEIICVKGVDVAQCRFRNAKKRFIQKYHREPEFSNPETLKEFTKIYSGKVSGKKINEVLQIANNLSDPIKSIEAKMADRNNSPQNEFKLMDVMQDTNDTPEEDCIKQKNREMLIKEIETTLEPEQANLMKIYYRLDVDSNEELTKEAIAEKMGWKRYSKTHKKVVVDGSRVKNGIDASKQLLKQNPVLRPLLRESLM